MSLSVSDLEAQLTQLRLSEAANQVASFLRQAEQESWTYLEFLSHVTTYECDQREQKRIKRLLKWAQFPYHQSLETFDLKE